MKNCLTCGHSQEDGKFCGKCGTPLESAALEQAATINNMTDYQNQPQPQAGQAAQETSHSSDQIELLKKQSKLYFNHFLEQLKKPSADFNVEIAWKNNLTSMIIYVLITALSVFLLIKSFTSRTFGLFESYGPSIIQVILYVSLFLILLMAINVLAIFLTSKLFSENLSFTNVISKIGSYYALPIAVTILSILFGLLKSYTYSMIMLYIGFVLAIGIIPIFVMVKLLSNTSKIIDNFYSFIFYLVVTAILTSIIFSFIIDSTIGDYLSFLI
ncbi:MULTISPECIES: zinc ribbon domain-containing protein [Lysinibacillus]|uniref:Zinc ribbon domain-containing protein n=1 Tax=Lysinibacillus fusiformis TaxID=28031 RepID=A0A2I0V5Y3_9BACI|nr:MULTISPECIES: zinc ribbon domain-containing protein [Lysinibacillus]KUF35482.1 hypothetical protein AK833_06935 [Lysinibacillus sp. F5]PKU53721.1 zinc ribbon domain-containing protein [Lysinibacillus fusiformis]